MIALAMMMGSVGLGVFMLPNHITMGGVGGIASILYWGLNIPVTTSYLVINISLLLLAFWLLGWRFCAKTIYAVVVFTGTLAVVQHFMGDTHLLKDQPFMATVVGAFFMGGSSGLGLACNASTGGSDTIAAMVNKYYDISLGHIVFICDLVIITSSYLVLHDWEMVIYGYVFLFIFVIFIDQAVNMMRRSVQFFIISDKSQAIGQAINERAQRGCTVIDGHGFYSGKDVKILFVLARQTESSSIFRLIEEIDPNAFVSQSAVIGVYGLGFDRFKMKLRDSRKPNALQS
ncbi:PF10035 family protein [Segatella baroniae F0067]|uniref:PF10035 family protein n=1 Tax=Segatella baroniae F0067 TaxID=1115809 RepID=U2P5L2_9BACT|nr:PF10035 family protein [Segatella baroniae F0067]